MTQKDTFLSLVRLGIGLKSVNIPDSIDWLGIEALAVQQGLMAVVIDGIEKLPDEIRPPRELLLQWIGIVMQEEQKFAIQQKEASRMAQLFHHNYIRTYVLKGNIIAECYPNPAHRVSADMDCFLLPDNSDFDAWNLGNDLIKSKGFEVRTSFYKNSTFFLPGLMVENHKYLTPFRGNNKLKHLEIYLQGLLLDDDGVDRFDGTWLYRPPVMVSALFMIEHAYSHFLHEGLNWRFVADWVLFKIKHKNEIDWFELSALIEEFGFKKFFDSFDRLGLYLLADVSEDDLLIQDKRMIRDVWANLDLHETTEGFKGKMNLVGNTLRARWKYHYFADISMLHALCIQAKGVLIIRKPSL